MIIRTKIIIEEQTVEPGKVNRGSGEITEVLEQHYRTTLQYKRILLWTVPTNTEVFLRGL